MAPSRARNPDPAAGQKKFADRCRVAPQVCERRYTRRECAAPAYTPKRQRSAELVVCEALSYLAFPVDV